MPIESLTFLLKGSLKDQDRKDKFLLDTVGSVRFDFDQDGSMASTKKFISVVDIQGKTYTITIEENGDGHTI